MANFTFKMPKELAQQLERASNLEVIAPMMIDEAGPILVEAVKKRLAVHRRTGALEKSVRFKSAKKAKGGGYFGKAYFSGYDKASATKANPQGTANEIKAMGLEWGTSKQPASPFIDAAKADCENQVLGKMQEVFNREAIK